MVAVITIATVYALALAIGGYIGQRQEWWE